MKYANGRVAKLNDKVLAVSPQGTYIGTVVAFENNAAFKIQPMFCQSAIYHDSTNVLLLSDALLPADQIKPVTA